MADAVDVLQHLGGCATFADLRRLVSAWDLRSALARGLIRRTAKGVYALPLAPPALAAALSQGGVLSHLSAAEHWGFDIVKQPVKPHVTIPPHRARRQTSVRCHLHWADVPVDGHATTPLRTVIDCARILPFGEALAIADSALRLRAVTEDDLTAAAKAMKGAGRRRIARVLDLADRRAESVLESMLRAILIEAGITGFVPQVVIQDRAFAARVDLANRDLRIVIEADSFAYHGTRSALAADCQRYTNLTIRGWRVLRFSWEDVMFSPEWVASAARAAVDGLPPRTNLDELAA